jgi:TolB protein
LSRAAPHSTIASEENSMVTVNSILAVVLLSSGPLQTTARYDDMWPAWSPDGRRIVFTSTRDGDPEVYVMNADGSEPRRLTTTAGRDAHPSWSPDGKTIAFQSPRIGGHTRIFLMNPDGSNQRPLTENTGFCGVPIFSPDGKRIVFQCTEDVARMNSGKPWQLFTVGVATGGAPVPLIRSSANDQVPNFSPDGRQIVFYSDRSGMNRLYLIPAEGGEPSVIGHWSIPSRAASWSPDGRRILFQSGVDGGTSDIYVTDPSGRTPQRLTDFGSASGVPVYSPDGKLLAFNATLEGSSRIFVMDADGRNRRALGQPQ